MESLPDPISLLKKDGLTTFFQYFVTFDQEQREDQTSKKVQELEQLLLMNKRNRENINLILKIVKRCAHECPFPVIAERFMELLEKSIKKYDTKVTLEDLPYSIFIPSEELPKKEHFEKMKPVFEMMFMKHGRIFNHERLLSLFPDYLTKDQFCINLLLENTILPRTWNYYLALMGVCTYECEYLFKIHQKIFYQIGGPPEWITEGFSFIPEKLKEIQNVNQLLANKPWAINSQTIEDLVRKKWRVKEILLAASILICFHGKACLVIGQGITSEYDLHKIEKKLGKRGPTRGREEIIPMSEFEEGILGYLATTPPESPEPSSFGSTPHCFIEQEKLTISPLSLTSAAVVPETKYSKIIGNTTLSYEEFQKKHAEYLGYHDFSWSDGYEILSDLNSEVATAYDQLFRDCFSMTKNFFGKTPNVNTQPIRQAILNYSSFIFGVIHEDYDYSCVNKLLTKELKTYIKEIQCSPNQITKEIYENMKLSLLGEEKLQINLIAIEIKKQNSLVYLAQAIGQYFKEH